MKIYEITEDAPTMTAKQAALKKQQQAALLKSKTTDSGMVDKMNIVGKGMQDKVNKTQADADSLSRAAGIDPNQVNKDIQKSLSSKPKFRNRFRKTTETTTAGSVATSAQPMGQIISRNMYKKDGTMKNALDSDNLMGKSKKNKRSKKA